MRQIIATESSKRCGTPRRRMSIAASVALAALLASGCNMPVVGGPSAADRVAQIEETRDRELRLAAAARNSGQPETALGIYEKLLKAEPENMLIHAGRAEALFELGAQQQALSAFNHALNLPQPSHQHTAMALTGRGRTLLALGQADYAETDFIAALEFSPGNAVAINGQAVANDMLGRHETAQSLYQQALAHDPGNTRVQSNLGLSYALAARFNDAVAQLAPIASGRETTTRARHNLALTFGLMGQPQQAEVLTRSDLDSSGVASNGKFYNLMQTAVGNADGSQSSYIQTTPKVRMNDAGVPNALAPPRVEAPVQPAPPAPALALSNPGPLPERIVGAPPQPALAVPADIDGGIERAPAPETQPAFSSSDPTAQDLATPPDLVTLQQLKAKDPEYADADFATKKDEATSAVVFGPELNLLETTPEQN